MDSRAQHFVECENCEKPGKYFCNPCQSKLCDECVSPHLKLKSAKGHEIVEYHKRKDANNCCAEHPEKLTIAMFSANHVIFQYVSFALRQNISHMLWKNCQRY